MNIELCYVKPTTVTVSSVHVATYIATSRTVGNVEPCTLDDETLLLPH